MRHRRASLPRGNLVKECPQPSNQVERRRLANTGTKGAEDRRRQKAQAGPLGDLRWRGLLEAGEELPSAADAFAGREGIRNKMELVLKGKKDLELPKPLWRSCEVQKGLLRSLFLSR